MCPGCAIIALLFANPVPNAVSVVPTAVEVILLHGVDVSADPPFQVTGAASNPPLPSAVT